MDEIQVFRSDEFGSVRTAGTPDRPEFCARDVALALGYKRPADAVRQHCKGSVNYRPLETSGGVQEVGFITEGDMYRLIASSKLESAQRFESWVFDEVLPAIRRDGGYMVARDETPEETMARAILMAQSTMERQRARIAAQDAEISELRPKAFFADAVAASDGTCLVGELAKMLTQAGVPSMGQNRLFERLRSDGFLIGGNRSDRNMPTQRSVELGLFKIKETVVVHSDGHSSISKTPKITQKGVRYLFDRYSTEAAYA